MEEECEEHQKKTMMYCETCDEKVCLRCISSTHKGHMMCPPKKTRKVPIGKTCPIHNRQLLHVCKTCNKELLCWNCYYPKHVKHETMDFDMFMQLTYGQLDQTLEDTKVKGHIDLATAQIKQRRDELKAQVDFMGDRFVQAIISESKKKPKVVPKFKMSNTKEKEIANLFGYLSY